MRIKKTGKPAKQDNTRVKKPLDPAIIKLLEARKELSPYPSVSGRYQGATSITEIPSNKDSLAENLLEAIPFYGSFLSWDDAQEAYRQMRQREALIPTANEAIDMFGAVPIANSLAKAPGLASDLIQLARQSPKYLQILENLIGAYDSAQDISEDNIK